MATHIAVSIDAGCRGQEALAAIKAKSWPRSPVTREEVSEYVQINARIEAGARDLQVQFCCHHSLPATNMHRHWQPHRYIC